MWRAPPRFQAERAGSTEGVDQPGPGIEQGRGGADIADRFRQEILALRIDTVELADVRRLQKAELFGQQAIWLVSGKFEARPGIVELALLLALECSPKIEQLGLVLELVTEQAGDLALGLEPKIGQGVRRSQALALVLDELRAEQIRCGVAKLAAQGQGIGGAAETATPEEWGIDVLADRWSDQVIKRLPQERIGIGEVAPGELAKLGGSEARRRYRKARRWPCTG